MPEFEDVEGGSRISSGSSQLDFESDSSSSSSSSGYVTPDEWAPDDAPPQLQTTGNQASDDVQTTQILDESDDDLSWYQSRVGSSSLLMRRVN